MPAQPKEASMSHPESDAANCVYFFTRQSGQQDKAEQALSHCKFDLKFSDPLRADT